MILQRAKDDANTRDLATFEAWGGPLPLEFYLAAVGRLRRHAWSRDHADVWLLRSDQGDVLSSCEAYRMASRIQSGAGHAYAVGNVYTEPALRGRGYATELLGMLALQVTREDPAAQALILFSDVALKTYEKAGFKARPALSLAFPARSGDPQEGVEMLLKEDGVVQAMAGLPLPSQGFTVLPAPGQIDWHLEREWIFAELFHRARPQACGARLGESVILWCADFVKETLDILLLHAPGGTGADALLACAGRVAAEAGLKKAVLWSSDGERFRTRAQSIRRMDTLDAVPMILPLVDRVKAEDWNWIPKAIWV